MKTIEALKPLTLKLALAIVLVLPAGVSAQQLQIELFPSTVIEALREVGQAVEAFETDIMMPTITALQNELAEYDKLKCRDAVADPGCMQAERLLGDAYSRILDSLNEHIPDMLNSMEHIKEIQVSSISRQIGCGLTPVSDPGCMQAARLLGDACSATFTRGFLNHLLDMLNLMENTKETQGSSIRDLAEHIRDLVEDADGQDLPSAKLMENGSGRCARWLLEQGSAGRYKFTPSNRYGYINFRLVQDLNP